MAQLEREYVKALRDGGVWSGGPAKLFKFIALQTIGPALTLVMGPASIIASLGISATDSFLLDKIKLGFKPRYFIDDLRHKFFPNQ